jgi:hypothetical protein
MPFVNKPTKLSIEEEKMNEPKVSEQDLVDLIICGNSWLGDRKNLFYTLKTKILETYGMPYGYALQHWDDECYDNYWENPSTGEMESEWFATHHHILRRYFLSTQDGRFISHEFHIPTNEFSYWNSYGIEKESENYGLFYEKCTDKFNGKKSRTINSDRKHQESAWQALKRLVRKYKFLLTPETING